MGGRTEERDMETIGRKQPLLDDNGTPVLNKHGDPVLTFEMLDMTWCSDSWNGLGPCSVPLAYHRKMNQKASELVPVETNGPQDLPWNRALTTLPLIVLAYVAFRVGAFLWDKVRRIELEA